MVDQTSRKLIADSAFLCANMASGVLFLLVLVATISCRASAQECVISPVWIFSSAEDIRPILQGIECKHKELPSLLARSQEEGGAAAG